MGLVARQWQYDDDCYQDRYTGRVYCNRRSAWNTWARWVVLGVIILGFLILFFLCSCITARRRRRAGRTPYYGTGWAARPGANNYPNNNPTSAPYYANNSAPAPPYSAAPNNNYGGGANQGYYGGATELQSPQPTYGGYAPPAGPPPGKSETGVVR